jgi:hypothetical protein
MLPDVGRLLSSRSAVVIAIKSVYGCAGVRVRQVPSSPSTALFQGGNPLHFIHRAEIERHDASQTAELVTDAFDDFWGPGERLT